MASLQSIDQLNRSITLAFPAKRIISLVPSQTEFLFDLGLDAEIVGLTRFCVHPRDKVNTKEKIGGTKHFDIEKIKALKPDLIIGNKEENYEAGIEELQKKFPVWMSDISDLGDAYGMMKEVSRLVNKAKEGEKITASIKLKVDEYRLSTLPNGWRELQARKLSAAYFIWRKPYMVAAKGTFIDHMLEMFGLRNALSHLNRYPEINPEILMTLKPDYIFLSSEPYAFSDKHFDEFRSYSPSSKIFIVNGEMFSWYGSRLRLAPDYFFELRKKLLESV